MILRKRVVLRAAWTVPLLALLAAVCLIGVPAQRSSAQTGPELALDLNLTGGACATIDSTISVTQGTPVTVAVCLVSNPNNVAVAAYGFHVLYDDTIVYASGGTNTAPALDSNPDANAGSTTFSTPDLGGGWDCTGGVGAGPIGDVDATVNGTGNAYSGGCGSAAGPNTLVTGPLAEITFSTNNAGDAVLTFGTNNSVTDDNLAEIGSCPTVDVAMTCTGGTITVTSSGGPTSTATTQPTATSTAAATATACTVNGVACTPTPVTSIVSATPTPTKTAAPGTGTATAPTGGSPVASATAVATKPGGGTGAGGITPPSTGDGPGGGHGVGMYVWLLLALGGGLALTGAVVGWRRNAASARR